MKAFMQFIVRQTAAFTAMGSVALVSVFAFETALPLAAVYGLAGGVATYYSTKQLQIYRDAKKSGLTRKEYQFITENLKEAKKKIVRLQRAFINVRQLGNARDNFEILRTVKRIYANTKREPHRFFQAEAFYYKHLDSLVEIAEKYAYLSQQPVKSREMHEMMRDSRHTILVLGQTVNKDLKVMLRDDVETLDFELDFARKTIQSPKKTKKTNGSVSS